jgi:hypothetical protein
MGTVITNLKARFGVDNSDFRKGLKDGERAVDDFKGAAGSSVEQLAGMFGVNMGAVNDAIGTASKSANFFYQSMTGAAKGGNILAISLKTLKVALISTGIGAIVVLLGSVIAYFQKSGEGADKFAKILMQMKSVLNNVVERLVAFGEGVVDIFSGRFKEGAEKMRTAFKGIGKEIVEDWKAAGDLADREDALEDKEIALINSLEERRAKIAELRLQAKEETEDQQKRLALLKDAEKLIKGVYGDQISIEKERLSIMKEKLAIQAKDPTDEQRKEIAEQEAKINGLLRERNEQLKGLTRESNSVKEAVKKQFQEFQDYSNLKMPQFLNEKFYENLDRSMKQLQHTAIQTKQSINLVFETLGEVAIDATSAVNEAFESVAVGMGELMGNLLIGNAGIKDFGLVIIGTFADLAVTVGKIAIGAGMAVLGIKQALMSLNPFVAIAAGVALVAIGTAVKGSLSKAASGGAGSVSSPNNFTFDTRNTKAQPVEVRVSGTLEANPTTLKWVLDNENARAKNSTGR